MSSASSASSGCIKPHDQVHAIGLANVKSDLHETVSHVYSASFIHYGCDSALNLRPEVQILNPEEADARKGVFSANATQIGPQKALSHAIAASINLTLLISTQCIYATPDLPRLWSRDVFVRAVNLDRESSTADLPSPHEPSVRSLMP